MCIAYIHSTVRRTYIHVKTNIYAYLSLPVRMTRYNLYIFLYQPFTYFFIFLTIDSHYSAVLWKTERLNICEENVFFATLIYIQLCKMRDIKCERERYIDNERERNQIN